MSKIVRLASIIHLTTKLGACLNLKVAERKPRPHNLTGKEAFSNLKPENL